MRSKIQCKFIQNERVHASMYYARVILDEEEKEVVRFVIQKEHRCDPQYITMEKKNIQNKRKLLERIIKAVAVNHFEPDNK